MKKQFICLLSILLILIFLSSCNGTTNPNENDQDGEIKYSKMSADWMIYNNSQELIEEANVVYVGKVTDISFQVLDGTNAMPPTDNTQARHRYLYTIYDVEIISSYKGNQEKNTKFRVMGGLKDYNVNEQIKLMNEENADNKDAGIPIWEEPNKTKCKIGETYLFVLYQFETGIPTVLNLEQSIFPLDDPTKKQTIGTNDKTYYSGETDEFGMPLISPQDIISEFGQDKWNEFYQQWQENNLIGQLHIQEGDTYEEVVEALGSSGKDIGSGAILYEWTLNDSKRLLVWFEKAENNVLKVQSFRVESSDQ